ncbi:NAD(P)-binding protein [Lentithecium fluviatile CBS 122367]|uniref:NAD(P)-binding protein n=1 Tax=Lentithecium fluviatile CBS 122367 TaxID=1168545 RepID=A0A6G1IDV7_9PLEO|nr:NAD(P)-binding protein [Lentithecium fluviatile CBS 122367]
MHEAANEDKFDIDASALFNCRDVVAVVTGGGTGIGLMIAQALERNGAKCVYIVGRRAEVLDRAAKTSRYGRILPFPGDVTDRSRVSELVATVQREFGRLDVLVNCAAVMSIWHRDLHIPNDGSVESVQKVLMNEAKEDWAAQFNVNVTAVYFLIAAFLSLLKQSNDYWEGASEASTPILPARTAQVITVAGIAAFSRAMAGCMGYVASKAAVLHLMKTLSTVMAPTGIRFNCICPGIFPSEITAGKGHLDEENRNQLGPISKSEVPQGRSGNVQDMAGAALFLCGGGGTYCNGLVLVLDGGRLSISPSTY